MAQTYDPARVDVRSEDRVARTLQYVAWVLSGMVTMGWMAAIGFGISMAVAEDAEYIRDVGAVLGPGLMVLAGLAITAVIATLVAIIRRNRVRFYFMSRHLPHLYGR